MSNVGIFGLAHDQARAIIEQMVKIVANWKDFYEQNGVTAKDIQILESAFRTFESFDIKSDLYV